MGSSAIRRGSGNRGAVRRIDKVIECPICHVMNEEQAHFCSECGQRFAPSATQPTFQTPVNPAPEPVFPSFPPADRSAFPQPNAVQDYQQSSGGFGAPVQSGFGAQPNVPAPQDFGNPAPPSPGYLNPQAQPSPPSFEPPGPGGFNPHGSGPGSAPGSLPGAAPGSAPGFGSNPNLGSGPNFGSAPGNAANPIGGGLGAPGNSFNPSASGSFNSQQSYLSNPGASPGTSPGTDFAPHESSSTAFPPEPETPNSTLPPRPKLHSPIFDGPDTGAPQPSKPGFGAKPKMRSPLLGEDDSEVEAPKPKSGHLRSPLLRGEDDPDHPQRGKGSQRSSLLSGDDDDIPPAPSAPKSKGGLRSPLLGAADDDFVPQPKPVRAPKGLPPQRSSGAHLRSPLLGGVDDYEGDEDDDDLPPVPGKTPFPHVKRHKDPVDKGVDSASDQTTSGRFPGKGLRSPLLGDASDAPASTPSRPAGGRPKLHSPIMDGPGGGQSFEDDYDEPYYEEIDDPNVLRSPLLAARSKHVAPDPPAQPAAQIKTPAPQAQPPAAFPSTNSFAEPAAPAAQPEFRERGFPAPQPPGDMWRDRGFPDARGPEPKSIPSAPIAPPTPPEVASSIKDNSPASSVSSAPSLRRSSRSGLLSGGASDDIDDQPINNFRNNAPVASPMPAMILMFACVVAAGAKLWYMALMGKALTDSLPFLADQAMQLIVIIALIFFAAMQAKR